MNRSGEKNLVYVTTLSKFASLGLKQESPIFAARLPGVIWE